MKKEKIIGIEKEEKKENKNDKKHIRNKILVNIITGIRALGSVAIIPIFLTKGCLAAGIASILFFATDFIDGQLARRLHVQSFFGSLLDGLSDKAFGIICLLLLSTLNPLFLVIIGLEIGILAVNYKSIERGNNAKSSMAGKAKTLLLSASTIGSYFCYAAPSLKEVLNYLNISSLNKILEINPDILSTCLAIPAIASSAYVLRDYKKKGKEQDELRIQAENKNATDSLKEQNIPLSLEAIEKERRRLLEERQKIETYKLKSKDEIKHALFDTDFYLEHKDDGIKKLLYK